MRNLIFICFVFITGLSFSQQKEEDDSKNKQEKTSSKPESEEAPVIEEVQSREENKKVSAKKKVDQDASGMAPGKAEQAIQKEASTFNYYNSQSKTQREQRSPTPAQQSQMNGAVSYFETHAPESFEYHYYKYIAGNHNTSLVNHLKEAEKIRPNNTDVQVQLAAYYMIQNSTTDVSNYLEKLVSNGRLAKSVVIYAEDVLRSVPKNGVLITHGFDDTYGAWYAQTKKGIRGDVKIISLDLLQSTEYRAKLKKEGFTVPSATVVDVKFLEQFCQLNEKKNLAISLTTPKEYFQPILSDIYLTGLVFEYKTTKYDNFWRNNTLWNSELDKKLVQNTMDAKGRELSANYLPMLMQMRKVYNQKGMQEKVSEIDSYIDAIGAQSKKYEQVQKMKSAY